MHGGRQSRPRYAGLPAGDGPRTYRDQPGDTRDRPGGEPDHDPQYQTCAVPAGQGGDYPAEAGSGGRPTRPHGFRSRGRRRRRRQIRAARRTIAGRHPVAAAVLAVIVLLTPVWISLGNALANPGLGTSVAARGAEWFRGHGGSGIVNWAENLWYSHHPPPVGGAPAQSAIPSLGPATGGPAHTAVAHLPAPRRLTSPAGRLMAGEGVWHPAGRRVDGLPAVYETWVRPERRPHQPRGRRRLDGHQAADPGLVLGQHDSRRRPVQAHRPGPPARGQDPGRRVQLRFPDDQRQWRLLHRRPNDPAAAQRRRVIRHLPQRHRRHPRLGSRRCRATGRRGGPAEPGPAGRPRQAHPGPEPQRHHPVGLHPGQRRLRLALGPGHHRRRARWSTSAVPA